jgi:hypothetical protein
VVNEVIEQPHQQPVDEVISSAQGEETGSDGEGEFQVTIRKLEMPVRPRGVLAE